MDNIEDLEYVANEHDRLVSAISKLDKTQHITEPTRSEPTNLNTEFNLIKRTNKLNFNEVAKILKDTAGHVEISKQLQKTQAEANVLKKPLEKPHADRIKRATGYDEIKKKIGRWDPVVARSRTVDYVSFPLNKVNRNDTRKLQPTDIFLSKFKLKSDLEKELEELDPALIKEDEEEEEQVFPISFEEMVKHRQQLAKLRAQQSYKAAKAKRQSKIKSKKYHRVLKKEKLKQQLKEFEELQKKDPEEALKKLEAIEKARALERHTLRHKNTGKWAKNQMIRAKYDKDVRQQIAEQLAVSRSLTQKIQDHDSTDDEGDDNVTTDIALSHDPMNPWMLQRPDKSNVNAEFDFGYKKYIQDKMFKQKDESDSDSNNETEADNNENNSKINTLKKSINKFTKIEYLDKEHNNKTLNEKQLKLQLFDHNETIVSNDQQNLLERKKEDKNTAKKVTMLKIKKPISTSDWIVEAINELQINKPNIKEVITSAFEDHESTVAQKVERKLNQIRKNIESLEKASKFDLNKNLKSKETSEQDNIEYLKFKNKKLNAMIDEELIETTSKTIEQHNDKLEQTGLMSKISDKVQVPVGSTIDPITYIGVKQKYLNTALPIGDNEYDQLDDDDEQVVPKLIIDRVFEEDDFADSFRKEKEDEINKDKLENVSATLPGWGAWCGKGVKAPKRKINRFITKAAPKIPRRDDNKGDIIIKEYKDPKLDAHKIKDVPFPFESVKDYEASIRAPLGNTFIPETAYKKLIKPSVFTKAGTIIEPMDEEELLVPRNRSFKNEAIMKILGQK